MRALERALRLQHGDLPRGLLLVACLMLVICAYVVGQVARNALFLDRFSAALLPYADLSVFLLVGVVVAVYIRAGRRANLRQLMVGSVLLFGAAALVFAVLARRTHSPLLFPAVYVWVGIFGVLAPAQVWTLANHVLAPREAKRLFGLVGSGATLGAAAGGFLSSAIAVRFGAESLLVLMAALLFAAAGLVEVVWRRRPPGLGGGAAGEAGRAEVGGLRDSLRLVLGSPHLRTVAALIVASSFVTSLTGWQLKSVAQRTLVGKDALAAFFGAFDAWIGVACLVTQLLLTGGILKRFRLGTVLLLLPAAILAGSTVFLAWGTLAAAAALKAADKVLRYSVDRPATELLYLPVSSSLRIPAKSFIDTVVWRAGDGLSGLAVLAFATLGGMGAVRLTWVVLPCIVGWIVLTRQAHRRYVATLEESVRKHVLETERPVVRALDRTTTELLAARLETVDPQEILYALDLLSAGGRPASHPAIRGLLDHPAPAVRRRALEILAEAEDLSVLLRAEVLLHDPDLEVRTEALLYLSRCADLDPLVRLQDLGDFPDFSIRAAVVAVLARLGGDRVESARLLFESMAAEPGEEGRRARLEAARLAERLSLPFEDTVARLVADPDPDVARAAIRASSRHGTAPPVTALVGRLGDSALRDEAAAALAGAGEAALGPLAAVLADRQASPDLREAVPGVLARIGGDTAAAVLVEHLLDGNATLRLRILHALGRMRDHDPALAIDRRLLEAALGAEILGHYRSYQILGAFGPTAADERPIGQGLRTAMTEEVERIFRLLHLLETRRDFRATWMALQSRDPVLHDQALDLLDGLLPPGLRALVVPLIDPAVPEHQRERLAGRHSGPPLDSPVQAVEALAGTGDPWLRACAAYAIGELELRELTDRLEAWRDDPDPLLRETVRQARARLAGQG